MRYSGLSRDLTASRRLGYLIAIFLSFTHVQATAKCYLPNGQDRNNQTDGRESNGADAYLPCNPQADGRTIHSMCCRTANNENTCLPNGLCLQSAGNLIWRESCTDQSWNSIWCLKLFITDEFDSITRSSLSSNDQQVTKCTDGSWCLSSEIGCCGQGKGFNITGGYEAMSMAASQSVTTGTVASTAPTSPATPSTAAASPATSSSSDSTAAAAASATSSIDTRALVGCVVGGNIAVIVLVAAAFFCIRRYKRQRNPRVGRALTPAEVLQQLPCSAVDRDAQKGFYGHSPHADVKPSELPVVTVHEMDGPHGQSMLGP